MAKLSEAEQVEKFMAELEHPFKAELEALRNIIKNANSKLQERVKWNSPSYYYQADFAAFNLHKKDVLHLVLVFPQGIVGAETGILEGDYKDRRMVYFTNMADVKAKQAALEQVINAWVERMEGRRYAQPDTILSP